VFDGPMIDEVMDGIADRGVLSSCDGVLSGYMGSSDIGAAILSAVKRVKTANPKALYCCDPVIGDVGRGIFVRPGVPEFMRDNAVPAADIVTPNHFELDYLVGASTSIEAMKAAIARLRGLGPRIALVTSLKVNETPSDQVDLIAADAAGVFRVRTPKLKLSINGAGDAIAALFFVHMMKTGSAAEALKLAASSVYSLLRRTEEAGAREILTVAAQDEFVAPTWTFPVEPV